MPDPLTHTIADVVSGILGLMSIGWVAHILNVLMMAAAITWVVKLVWYSGKNRKERKKATVYKQGSATVHKRANKKKSKPPKNVTVYGIFSPTGWWYDEKKGEWIAPDYLKTQARDQWEWDEEKRIWIDKYKK